MSNISDKRLNNLAKAAGEAFAGPGLAGPADPDIPLKTILRARLLSAKQKALLLLERQNRLFRA